MANIKNITKKLVNLGFSEDKLMMMTEKEIREAYKVAKEESTMKNNTNTTATNNSTTVVKEEITMKTREFTLEELVQVLTDNQKVQDAEYIKKDDLRVILNQQFELGFNNRATRTEMINTVMTMYKDSLDIADEIAYGNVIAEDSVSVGDLDITHDNIPESIESDPTPVVENPTPVSDAKAKTIELLNLIHDHAKDNKAKGYGTTISSHMIQAYILKVGHNIPKLKGHTVTKDEYETTIRVYKWLLNNGYIKPCAYSVNEDNRVRVYVAEYDGKTGNVGHGTVYVPYNATNAAKYTIKKAVLFAVK